MNINTVKKMIEPFIGPALRDFENSIVRAIKQAEADVADTADGQEVVFIILQRQGKAIIAPAIADANNTLHFDARLENATFKTQPLKKFILKNL